MTVSLASARWLVLLALFISGCARTFTDAPLTTAIENIAAEPTEVELAEPTVEEVEQLLATQTVERNPATKAETVQTVDGWYRSLAAGDHVLLPRGEYRWRHDGLGKLFERYGNPAAALKLAQRSAIPYVAPAATIGRARLAPEDSKLAREVAKLARDPKQPPSLRRAAIETLSQTAAAQAELNKLRARYAPHRGELSEPKLYAEVLLALARGGEVESEVLAEALTLADVDVQLAALAAIAAHPNDAGPPAELAQLATAGHARVRRAALAALVALEHPDAFAHVRQALADGDPLVRLEAIALLADCGGTDGALLLNDLSQDKDERHRSAAVAPLAARGEWDAIARSARDQAYRVRLAVATALADYPDARHAPLAQQLAADTSAMVQAEMCKSLAKWPAPLAAPLLFAPLASANQLTRTAALASLAHFDPALTKSFDPSAPPAKRAEQLAALRSAWAAAHPASATAPAEMKQNDEAAQEEVARLVRQYQSTPDRAARWVAQKQLERLGPAALEALDELVAAGEIELAEATYRELLPTLSPASAAIEKLRAADENERRAAARELTAAARKRPLLRLELARLGQVARSEGDVIVWGEMLRAAGHATEYPGHELALAALASGHPEIRRGACAYLALAGDARQSEALSALLNVEDPAETKAALAALGRCGPPASRAAVYELLRHHDLTMQLAAAQTLAQWKDVRGGAALERLALARDANTRRQAIAAIGQLKQPGYVDLLIRSLDDEQDSVRRAALAALPLCAGEDPLAKLPSPPRGTDEMVRAWREWRKTHEG